MPSILDNVIAALFPKSGNGETTETRQFQSVHFKPDNLYAGKNDYAWKDVITGELFSTVESLPHPKQVPNGSIHTAVHRIEKPDPSGNPWDKDAEFITSPNGDRVKRKVSGFDKV